MKDIDVTMDYSGSFDKVEVTEYLTTKKGFRIQGSVKDADRTILDNTDQVGNNCLTCIHGNCGWSDKYPKFTRVKN
jgi:hypothetical protein